MTLKLHKELVIRPFPKEPEVKDGTDVADDDGDLLVKEKHVEGVENALNNWVPRKTDSKEVIGARDPKIRAWMPLNGQSFG